ncbi:PREDICTED: uncharacterized protein LOC108774245 [Cyphomyrmex costatus]|nr:PREDICTED: uncharacterized protein LOC108774245 [Cyphomyrmex costatus]
MVFMVDINSITTASDSMDSDAVCTPWLGKCQITDECCRNLVCMVYAAKCVPQMIVGDTRPIGDGPFPPTN